MLEAGRPALAAQTSGPLAIMPTGVNWRNGSYPAVGSEAATVVNGDATSSNV